MHFLLYKKFTRPRKKAQRHLFNFPKIFHSSFHQCNHKYFCSSYPWSVRINNSKVLYHTCRLKTKLLILLMINKSFVCTHIYTILRRLTSKISILLMIKRSFIYIHTCISLHICIYLDIGSFKKDMRSYPSHSNQHLGILINNR